MPPASVKRAVVPDPIFILGITSRSGTSFLFHLLCLHPDCDYGGPIWGNYLMTYADLLVRYADSIYKDWNPNWKVGEIIDPSDLLLRYLGDSLISFLNLQTTIRSAETSSASYDREGLSKSFPKRLVTKTPSVRNLRYFFKLFPRAHLIIITRDGRAVVESGIKTFNWNFEHAIRNWADAARAVLQFDQDIQNTSRKYLIVRYEDLYSNMEEKLREIFLFLGLNAEGYDFDAAKSVPVIGSSELRERGEEKVHWNPIEKTSNFNPILRC